MTECIIVKTVRDIPRELIGENVEELMKYCNLLISQGYDSFDKIYKSRWKGGVVDADDKIPSSD